MKDVFKIGDLVEHTTLLGKLNRGFGVVVDVLAVEYDKINNIFEAKEDEHHWRFLQR